MIRASHWLRHAATSFVYHKLPWRLGEVVTQRLSATTKRSFRTKCFSVSRNELRKIENLMSQTFEHSESGWEELIDELPPTAAWTEVDWSCTNVQGLFCFYSVCLDLVNRMSPWCRARPRNLFLQLYCGDYRCPSVAARMSCQLALSVLNASWWKGVRGETEQCRTLRFRNSSRCPPVAQPASCARLFHGELFRENGSKTFSMNSFKQWLGRQVFEFGLLHLTPPANTFLT